MQPIPAKELANQLPEHGRFQDGRAAFYRIPHPSISPGKYFLDYIHLVLLTLAKLYIYRIYFYIYIEYISIYI